MLQTTPTPNAFAFDPIVPHQFHHQSLSSDTSIATPPTPPSSANLEHSHSIPIYFVHATGPAVVLPDNRLYMTSIQRSCATPIFSVHAIISIVMVPSWQSTSSSAFLETILILNTEGIRHCLHLGAMSKFIETSGNAHSTSPEESATTHSKEQRHKIADNNRALLNFLVKKLNG